MDYTDFIDLGFNENEAKVYTALIQRGQATAADLIDDTGFHKNIVYDNLNRLADRGLVTYIKQGGRRIYSVSAPTQLVDNIHEQREQLKEKEQKAQALADEINDTKPKQKHDQSAAILKGKQSIRSFLKRTLSMGDYLVFGAPQRSVNVMTETFWKNYTAKLQRENIHAKLIFNPGLHDYGESIASEHLTIRYLAKQFEPMTETRIHDDTVAIIVWTTPPILFKIKSEPVSNAYTEHFKTLWGQAQPEV